MTLAFGKSSQLALRTVPLVNRSDSVNGLEPVMVNVPFK